MQNRRPGEGVLGCREASEFDVIAPFSLLVSERFQVGQKLDVSRSKEGRRIKLKLVLWNGRRRGVLIRGFGKAGFIFFTALGEEGDGGGGGGEGVDGFGLVLGARSVIWEGFDKGTKVTDDVAEAFGGDIFDALDEHVVEIALLCLETAADENEQGAILFIVQAVFGDPSRSPREPNWRTTPSFVRKPDKTDFRV